MIQLIKQEMTPYKTNIKYMATNLESMAEYKSQKTKNICDLVDTLCQLSGEEKKGVIVTRRVRSIKIN